MPSNPKLIPIYTARGDLGAFLLYPHIYSPQGEWIGWVTRDREVFSVHGHYVGFISKGPRILRKLERNSNPIPRRTPPPTPSPILPPAHVPLAPPMPEVALNLIDVIDEAPELMPPIDYGDLREDMD